MRVIQHLAAIGLAMLAVTSLPARAQGAPPPGRPGPFGGPGGPGGPPDPAIGMAGRALHDLDFSRDQHQLIHELVRSRMDGELGSLARAFGEARHALEVKLWDPASTDQDIAAASEVVANRGAALEKGRRGLALEILAVLTETQREKFQELLAQIPEPPTGPPDRIR